MSILIYTPWWKEQHIQHKHHLLLVGASPFKNNAQRDEKVVIFVQEKKEIGAYY
jgi:hypothetical protein